MCIEINWDAVSAISSSAAVIIALVALAGWKNQEKLKVKLDFKNAISAYSYCLMNFPSQLNTPLLRHDYRDKSRELADLIAKAGWAWFATENLLKDKTDVVNAWKMLNDLHKNFLDGQANKQDCIEQCSIILKSPFVF
ncbi:hypothetical protein FYF90_06315 [Enterobacter sp. RVSM5a]|nr:hypothetical protein FYF90_06315 [Enterobacter sp. RVSM5a]